MSGPLRLAWKYVRFHRWKSAILVACIVLSFLLPVALAMLLDSFERQIVARADATPLVVGAPGSRLDLALHALYFQSRLAQPLPYQAAVQAQTDQLGQAIPLYVRYTARGTPIVGTTMEYLDFRDLELDRGSGLARLGDCVLGATAARRMALEPGDHLLSDPVAALDIAGAYPLNMRVVGILRERGTPDDDAVFVDLKTAWVIEGLGHGHQDVAQETDEGKILSREGSHTVASAAVLPYTEITDDNIASFHFHGDQAEFPISAVVVVPHDDKSATLLLGRYQTDAISLAQMIVPSEEVHRLLDVVFRVKRFFDANAILIAGSTALLLALVVALSARLRQREMDTMFRLGCGRSTQAALYAWELAIIFGVALVIVAALSVGVWLASDHLVRALWIGG